MKNKKILLAIVFLSISLILLGGTYAYWTWQTNESQKTLVTFTVTSDFSCSADAGGNITSSNVKLAPAKCNDPNYAIQRVLTVNTDIRDPESVETITANLWLDINLIDSGLSNSSNFKYAVTTTANDCSNPITSGTFKNKHQGDEVVLLESLEYQGDTTETYYLYIWLDEEEDSLSTMNQRFNFSVNGECSKNKFKIFNYTGDYQIYTVADTGYYKIETWGAQGGGTNSSYPGGKGGYSSGYIYLNSNDNLYIYVGSTGSTTTTKSSGKIAGGYNGGGYGNSAGAASPNISGGGGATDIRLINGTWDDATSLNSRIMVAAGGAGAYVYSGGSWSGKPGGTLIGGYTDITYAGKQTSGAYFGQGSNLSSTSGSANGAGGGGGYYGGSFRWDGAAGGGSSFISGYAGVNAITASDDRTHTNNTNHYSGKYFLFGEMQAGVNAGNGKVKITYIGSTLARKHTALDNVRYIKDCINGSTANTANHWVELQAIKNGINVAKGKGVTGTSTVNTSAGAKSYTAVTDGDITAANYAQSSTAGLQCITVDLENTYDLDEIAVWHYYTGGRTYYEHTMSVSADGEFFKIVINSETSEDSTGKRASAYSTRNISLLYTLRFKYTGKFKVDGDPNTYDANSTYATEWYSVTSPYNIKFLSSGTLTFDESHDIDAFIVGGGGKNAGCALNQVGGGYAWSSYYGGGGYHSVFTTTVNGNTEYALTVGASQQNTVAFGHTANKGGDAWCDSISESHGNGTGGDACDEFERSGSTYSGRVQSGAGPNTGQSAQSGIIIIRDSK